MIEWVEEAALLSEMSDELEEAVSWEEAPRGAESPSPRDDSSACSTVAAELILVETKLRAMAVEAHSFAKPQREAWEVHLN